MNIEVKIKKIVIAPNSFKEWKLSSEIAEIMRDAIIGYCTERGIQTPELDVVPIGDGGEGTIDAILNAGTGGIKTTVRDVVDPVGNRIESWYLSLPQPKKTAFIEMAKASGLYLIPPNQRNPLHTTSYGVGQLIAHAYQNGHRRIIIGVGGAGSHDGGAGMAQALGVELIDRSGAKIRADYMSNFKLKQLDYGSWELRGLAQKIAEDKNIEIEIASDVDNPLLGPQGASQIFGRQKGATDEQIPILERNLTILADVSEWLLKDTSDKRAVYFDRLKAHGIDSADINFRHIAGTGAAGGLSYGALIFLGAYIGKGMIPVRELVDLKGHIRDADLVITGEGRLDDTTFGGKVVMGVGEVARLVASEQDRIGKLPVITICGNEGKYDKERARVYVDAVYSTSTKPIGFDDIMRMGKTNLASTVQQAFDDVLHKKYRRL